jgi:hypothetical protein
MIFSVSRVFTLLFPVLAITGLTSPAANADDRDVCLQRDGAQSIDSCGRIIATGQLTGKDLATIYVLRASAYRSSQLYDRAISDMTRAIDLLTATASKDVVASAYVTRAAIYALSGDPTNALTDYQQALAFDGTNTQAAEAVKSLQAQPVSVATSSDGQSMRQFTIPNEPLPSEVPIPQDVLQIVQTHPLFANAPPVRIGAFSIGTSFNTTTSVSTGTTSMVNDEQVFVTWIRSGIVRDDMNSSTATMVAGNTEQGNGRSEMILAADGLVTLGSRSTSNTRFGTSQTLEKTVRLDNLSGHIFPMQLGNQFSYRVTTEQDTTMLGKHYHYKNEFGNSCSVIRQFDAVSFHPDLSGLAYLVQCKNRTKTVAANLDGQSQTIFFDYLGYWLSVDPVALREQIVSNGTISTGMITQTGMKFTSSTNGTYTLKSFSMAR